MRSASLLPAEAIGVPHWPAAFLRDFFDSTGPRRSVCARVRVAPMGDARESLRWVFRAAMNPSPAGATCDKFSAVSGQPEARAVVLVVDDNEANRALAKETLEDEGHRVVLASGGAEGIAAFERERPDCVLLDVRMPDMDGFAVCERIRASTGGRANTPVLFFTALRDVDTFDRALAVGGNDFLTKPVRPTELVVRVTTALALHRTSASLREHYDLLRHQRDDLLRLQLQKERLTAFVVHDLKSPVATLDLHAQVLLRDETLSKDARDSALQIRDDARKLGRMILNLLDVSKADEGKLVPSRAPFDVHAVVAGVFAEHELVAEAKAVRLVADVPRATVTADEDLVRRMLTNLVENALRHAPSESTVTVSTTSTDGALELRVIDAGDGVAPEMRQRIFDPFVQIDAGQGVVARSGRGLGLAFCKLAAEAHGGRIWIEDANPGAIFHVRILT